MNVTLGGPPALPPSLKPTPRHPNGRLSCGVCTGKCVYQAVNLAFLLGIFANAVVIARVARDQKLHKPTFMAIAGLATADMLYLAANLALKADSVAAEMRCIDRSPGYREYFGGVLSMVWFSAAFHVTLLAVLRFLVLTRPLLTRRRLTNRRVLLASAALWVLAAVCIGTNTLIINLPATNDDIIITVHIVGWFVKYFLPIVTTAILHVVKITFLRRSFVRTAKLNEHRRKSLMRMTRTIAMVIIAGAVLPLPKFVTTLILRELLHVKYPVGYRKHVESIAEAVFLFNFCINPFIYAFNSPAFRNSVKDMLGRRCDTTGKSQSTRKAPKLKPMLQATPLPTPQLTSLPTLLQTTQQSTSDFTHRHCEHI